MDLREGTAADAAKHWYYVSKGRAVAALLQNMEGVRLLDVGAGSGVFSDQLLARGVARSAVCVDPNYAEDQIAVSDDPRRRFAREASAAEADLVLMMDVIEHVDDDVALVGKYADEARPGTRFLVTVPAFSFLWSSHDEFLEHRRRYTTKQLRETLAAAGLDVGRTRYFFGLLFPAVAARRLTERKGAEAAESDMRPTAPALNAALIALHEAERRLLLPFNDLVGVTAMALATKP
jgi:SAM-dependent methyltransferase